MNEFGSKISKKRKDLGLTQNEFAERLSVTRQTVSRWESGAVLPDIDKLGSIAEILGVSCDYLLKDEYKEETETFRGIGVSRLLSATKGRKVKLTFFGEEEFLSEEKGVSLANQICTVLDFEGNWMRVLLESKKGNSEKLLPVSSVSSVEIIKED
ncbi:MAG: helix-turn-helix transcriptional regulator [Lachnospiraceae bacterium]|nr:helix-turn-helix transcriptional regulator [Lachnospiraceae bacterium]